MFAEACERTFRELLMLLFPNRRIHPTAVESVTSKKEYDVPNIRKLTLAQAKLRVLGNCIFWYWFTSGGFRLPNSLNWEMPGYSGSFEMLVGICTLLVWCLYAYQTREHSMEMS